MPYGTELIVDVHECASPHPFCREGIAAFCSMLCETLEMEKGPLHFWDYKNEPEEYAKAPSHLKGISAIQFITTSNITIHALDELNYVFFNIFSCKGFDCEAVLFLIENWTKGIVVEVTCITRQ